jgi:hypothetical protein
MIISRKKLNKKISEAVDRAEHERYILDRLRSLEDELNGRINKLHQHVIILERILRRVDDEQLSAD